jgi:NADH:ubiquinone oxidoreductase subunit F (NADH-binding)
VPCRLGTHQILHLIEKINQHADSPDERQKLEHLGQTIKKICACGLGMSAANPALTYLHHFEAV